MQCSGFPSHTASTQKRWNLNPKPMLLITNLQPSLDWIPTAAAIGLNLGFWYYQGQLVALTQKLSNAAETNLVQWIDHQPED